ncbi:hypothetical protein [Rhizobium phaseoli]|uniref:hypothetical protein n=1 Tax=Rhizobium phaseoli TaxID=396 RepID=UPI0012370975|nr:hypothetical protein [Rhizobium phaseoli]
MGTNDKRVRIGAAVPSMGSTPSDNPAQVQAVENQALSDHALPVYPASTVDCIVKTMNAALTAERKAGAESRLLLAKLVERINKLEATIPEQIREIPNTEHSARIQSLEKRLAEAEATIARLQAKLQVSNR